MNPLLAVPLNKKRVYVMAVASGDCEIYMPVDSLDKAEQLSKQADLQATLNGQGSASKPPPISA